MYVIYNKWLFYTDTLLAAAASLLADAFELGEYSEYSEYFYFKFYQKYKRRIDTNQQWIYSNKSIVIVFKLLVYISVYRKHIYQIYAT